jgi:hypothetical protein
MDEREKLARAVDRELKGLPDLIAPPVLTTRVMARVRELSTVSWWRRSWFEWPAAVRVATALVMAAWLLTLTGLGAIDWAGSARVVQQAAGLAGASLAAAFGLLGSVPLPVWLFLGGLAVLSWFTLLATSVFCWRLVRAKR